ncbi:MAG TPA: L-threonylcarbamoyladenylate synthase [Rhodocyclaceae bacterium]|jgi:tRNA threonylcarbamoyl adenosine modification protein (Sua5/YciO/YrdC/YwlC family)|nr:L-threonylcarbamoyladenylate synthase [Rhodocyclaceae bacterium]
MSLFFSLHSDNPQPRQIAHAAQIIREGGLIAMPTDAAYVLCGHTGDAKLLDRIRQIRDVDERHHFTLLCRDLSEIANYARVDNAQYRLLKAATPGSYTFILEGTKELPRRVLHPKRKTIGIRVPDHPVVRALLAELDEPLLSSTLLLPDNDFPLTDPEEIRDHLDHALDLIIEAGHCGAEVTTVVNLVDGSPELVRTGKGDPALLGL